MNCITIEEACENREVQRSLQTESHKIWESLNILNLTSYHGEELHVNKIKRLLGMQATPVFMKN